MSESPAFLGSEILTLPSGQTSFMQGRLLIWFSCGAASAVAAKMAIATHKGSEPIEVLYLELANEHEDNVRFRAECQEWLGVPIIGLRSKKYPSMDIFDVFAKEKYISGVGGARCTMELKRQVGIDYRWPEDIHVFGYTADEGKRIKRFEDNNPALRLLWILRDLGLTKEDCHKVIKDAGIESPAMYGLGFNNNNCKGCVKAQARRYWLRVYFNFPDEFWKMAAVSRAMGVRLIKHRGIRYFLDEVFDLPPDDDEEEDDIECGPQCVRPDEVTA